MKLQDLFVALGFEVDDSSLRRAESTIKGFIETVSSIKDTVTEVVQSLFSLATGAAHDASEISKLATVFGISEEAAQQWAYAASKTGVEINDLTELAAELAENLGESLSGTGEASDAFKSLGLSVKDAKGNLKQTPQMLMEIADKFSQMADGQKKTAAVTGLFGESGLRLLPTLNKGSAAIGELMEEAESLGIVLERDVIEQGVELSQTMTTLEAVFKNVKNTIAAEVTPVVTELVSEFLDWWKANKEIVKQRIQTVFRALLPVLKLAVGAFKLLTSVLGFVVDHFRLLAILLVSVLLPVLYSIIAANALQIIGWIAVQTAAVGAALRTAAAWVAASLPLLAWAAAIALVLLILDDIWGFFNNKDSVLGRIIDGWREKWNGFVNYFLTDHPDWWVTKALNGAIDIIKTLIGYVGDLINDATNAARFAASLLPGGEKYKSVEQEKAEAFGQKASAPGYWDDAKPTMRGLTPEQIKKMYPEQNAGITPEQKASFTNFMSGLSNFAKQGPSSTSSMIMPKGGTTTKQYTNNARVEIKIDGAQDPEGLMTKVEKVVRNVLSSEWTLGEAQE